jgi:Acetoacetate decarboxylase (ADC)
MEWEPNTNGTISMVGNAVDSFEVDSRTLPMPVRIRDAKMAGAVFLCDARAAERALSGTPFKPLRIGGRALPLLACVQYIDGDLDSYDEFGIELVVRGPDGKIGAFTLDLPVTASFTRSAGRAVWGLPKFVVDGAIVAEKRQTRFEVTEGDEFIMSGSIAGRTPVPGRFSASVRGWSVGLEGPNSGAVLLTPSRMRVRGVRFSMGGNRIALGQHPMAGTARSLGMSSRPLCSFTAQRMEAEIGGSIAQ